MLRSLPCPVSTDEGQRMQVSGHYRHLLWFVPLWAALLKIPKEVLLMFSQQLKRLAGPALITGGLLWITIHITMIIIITK